MKNPFQECIDACLACAFACTHCEASCLKEEKVVMMLRCIELDHQCAAICSLAVDAMARNSEFAKAICKLCAEICEACGKECMKHNNDHCRSCADACMRCVIECRNMSKAK